MLFVEQDRCREVNHAQALDQTGFEAAWEAFQNTPIDLLADSDDETCRQLHRAIRAYLART
jgi:hypothetical protein